MAEKTLKQTLGRNGRQYLNKTLGRLEGVRRSNIRGAQDISLIYRSAEGRLYHANATLDDVLKAIDDLPASVISERFNNDPTCLKQVQGALAVIRKAAGATEMESEG